VSPGVPETQVLRPFPCGKRSKRLTVQPRSAHCAPRSRRTFPVGGEKLKLVLTSALLGAFFLISGCSTQCESVAAAFDTCSVKERSFAVDGANFCGLIDAFNGRASRAGITGCDAKWTAHLTCWQQNVGKICDNTFDGCDQTATDWNDCVTAFCEQVNADPNG